MSGVVLKCNLVQFLLLIIRIICYLYLFKVNIKVIKYGCKYEDIVIKVYVEMMLIKYVNFKVEKCGFFINLQYFFFYVLFDFLSLCDCCGLGCGEVKCLIFI